MRHVVSAFSTSGTSLEALVSQHQHQHKRWVFCALWFISILLLYHLCTSKYFFLGLFKVKAWGEETQWNVLCSETAVERYVVELWKWTTTPEAHPFATALRPGRMSSISGGWAEENAEETSFTWEAFGWVLTLGLCHRFFGRLLFVVWFHDVCHFLHWIASCCSGLYLKQIDTTQSRRFPSAFFVCKP